MSKLEFEQKFVLDLRREDEIHDYLLGQVASSPSATILGIRQLYDDNGYRYRATVQGSTTIYVRENKRSIKLGTKYSVSIEDDDEILPAEFEDRWFHSNKRLQKTRFEIAGRYPDHKIMIDFFFSRQHHDRAYAVVAEAETMLTAATEHLFLRFSLPSGLEKYILKTVDDCDPHSKSFKSANMIDTPERITAVLEAYSRLYEPL